MHEIPFLNLRLQHADLIDEITQSIRNTIEQGDFLSSQAVRNFEAAFAEFCQIKHCVGVSSAFEAIYLALQILEIGPGDEVICASNMYIGTAGAVVRTGATIRFVDINPITLNIDVAKVEKAVSFKTKAIIATHLFGLPAEMEYLLKIANWHGLYLLEDASYAAGAAYRGKPVGTFGDMGCFGFQPDSHFAAFGHAGAIVTNSDALNAKLQMLSATNDNSNFEFGDIELNNQMDAIQAAVLNVKMKILPIWIESRRKVATFYRELFKKNKHITTFAEPGSLFHIYSRFAIQVENRDLVRQKLRENRVSTGIHHSVPLHQQPAFAKRSRNTDRLPVAESCVSCLLNLPIYPEMTEEMVKYVAENVIEAVEKFSSRKKIEKQM
jgi:dTDP-4-amino-4,6-dideoxygalactose transaminase